MALQAKRWSFTRSLVVDAPAHAGLYALWENDKLLHLGCADERDTIRDKLLAHLEAGRGKHATHYSWELSREPRRRASELMGRLGAGSEELGYR